MGGHDMLAANREESRQQAGKTRRPVGFADFAVLYRTDAQSTALREAFDKAGIPFKKSSPAPIAGQPLVRSLLAALERQGGEMNGAGLSARIAAAAEQIRCDGDPDIAALAEARRWLTALAHREGPVASREAAALREKAALATEADFWTRAPTAYRC
jgi:hypothetical protein